MLDVALPEMLVIVVVALLVIGPKDLPRVLRGLAHGIARLRRMVDEVMGSVNTYVRESELEELRAEVEKTRRAMKGQAAPTTPGSTGAAKPEPAHEGHAAP